MTGPGPTARAWREVDREALVHNARALQGALAPGCRLMAVLKADAYGHGAVETARALAGAGVEDFAVACLAEGVALRRAGVRGNILVLGWTDPDLAPLLARWDLAQAVTEEAHGRALAARGATVRAHLALDTGMHRLGTPAGDLEALARLCRLPGLRVEGLFSHLCCADSPDPADEAFTRAQLDRFYQAAAALRAAGLDPGGLHIQASYGVWNLPPQPCRWARAGIALYGVTSDTAPVRRPLGLRPALALRARVAQVRPVAAGEGAGYGLAWRPRRDSRLAVVTIGYGDGLPRRLAEGGGELLLEGRRCPLVGRLCMDQLLADVTDAPGAAPGRTVTLIGPDGADRLGAEEVAARCGTIANELLAGLGPRLPFVYR